MNTKCPQECDENAVLDAACLYERISESLAYSIRSKTDSFRNKTPKSFPEMHKYSASFCLKIFPLVKQRNKHTILCQKCNTLNINYLFGELLYFCLYLGKLPSCLCGSA